MVKCLFDEKDNIHKIKKINAVDVFECRKHQLALISSQMSKSAEKLYDFDAYKKNENQLRKRYQRILTQIFQLFNLNRDHKPKRVLDIGAGYGLFSSLLLETGQFNIEALEPNLIPYYLKKTKTIIYKKTLEEFLSENQKKYDLILLMDVIEHFNNPRENLRKLKSIFVEDSRLIIQTPNYQSLMARICHKWAWWMVEDHKFIFSPKSLQLLMKEAGYTIEFEQTYEDWIDFKKNLDGNFEGIKNYFLRKIIKASFLILFMPFYFTFRKVIWRYGYGGLIFIIVKIKN